MVVVSVPVKLIGKVNVVKLEAELPGIGVPSAFETLVIDTTAPDGGGLSIVPVAAPLPRLPGIVCVNPVKCNSGVSSVTENVSGGFIAGLPRTVTVSGLI